MDATISIDTRKARGAFFWRAEDEGRFELRNGELFATALITCDKTRVSLQGLALKRVSKL